jgi:type I restriction enzyme S subunit
VRTVELDEVCQINPPLSRRPEPDELVSFIGMADVDATDATTSAGEDRPFGEVSKAYTLFERGDVLVAKITPCFENCKIAQATPRSTVAAGSTEFHVVRPIPGRSDPRYVLHFLRQPRVRAQGEKRMTGSAGQRRVPANFVAKLPLPLPPIEEQRRIAAILDKADELRAKRRAALTHLDSLTQSIFLDMFGDPASSPSRWPVVPLASLVRADDRINYGVVQPGSDSPGGVPLIRVSDLVDGYVRRSSLKTIDASIESSYRRSRLRGDELLVSCVGSIGVVAATTLADKGSNIARAVARVPLRPEIGKNFGAHLLRSAGVQRYFMAELRTVSQPTLNIKQIAETPVILPPIELRQTFESSAAGVASVLALSRDHDDQLDHLFASLQQRAFSGAL